MNSRYVDEVELKTGRGAVTKFKASRDAFKPLGALVKQNGVDRAYFYFEDVQLELTVPKKEVSIMVLRTMDTIPVGYKYVTSLVFEDRALHVYMRT